MPRQFSEPRRSDFLYPEDYLDACKAWRQEQAYRSEYWADKAARRNVKI